MHDAQVGGIDVCDLSRAIHDADAILHGLQDQLQAFLDQCVLMQQLVHTVDFRRPMHLEIAFEETHHLEHGLPAVVAFGRDKDRVAAVDLERDELHEAVHLTTLTTRAAQEQMAVVALRQFLRPLHDHGRHAGMDAALIMDDGFLFVYHGNRPF